MPAQIIENARLAKQFIANADEEPLPDALLLRASVAYDMLVRKGVIVAPVDDLSLPHAIATIAGNFADDPASTPHRAAMFATDLGEAG